MCGTVFMFSEQNKKPNRLSQGNSVFQFLGRPGDPAGEWNRTRGFPSSGYPEFGFFSSQFSLKKVRLIPIKHSMQKAGLIRWNYYRIYIQIVIGETFPKPTGRSDNYCQFQWRIGLFCLPVSTVRTMLTYAVPCEKTSLSIHFQAAYGKRFRV